MVETAPLPFPQRGKLDEAILLAVEKFKYMTAEQVCLVCGLSPRSITHIREKLKNLADEKFLQRIVLPREARAGSGKLVFTLGTKGISYLAALGRICKVITTAE